MRKWIPVATALWCMTIGTQELAAQNQSAVEEISDLMTRFVNGWREGDGDALVDVFAMDQGRILWVGGEAPREAVNSMTFRAAVERDRPRPTYGRTGWRIASIDIVNDEMAVAKLEIEDGDVLSVDYMVCYRINGQWKIVANTFVILGP